MACACWYAQESVGRLVQIIVAVLPPESGER